MDNPPAVLNGAVSPSKHFSALSKYTSRHFQLTTFVVLVSTVALFTGHLDGMSWAAVVSAVVGAFRIGDAADTWVREGSGAGKVGVAPGEEM